MGTGWVQSRLYTISISILKTSQPFIWPSINQFRLTILALTHKTVDVCMYLKVRCIVSSQVYKQVLVMPGEFDTIIAFYNRVFMPSLKSYILQFSALKVLDVYFMGTAS